MLDWKLCVIEFVRHVGGHRDISTILCRKKQIINNNKKKQIFSLKTQWTDEIWTRPSLDYDTSENEPLIPNRPLIWCHFCFVYAFPYINTILFLYFPFAHFIKCFKCGFMLLLSYYIWLTHSNFKRGTPCSYTLYH